jgi:putative DNA primase/helicase
MRRHGRLFGGRQLPLVFASQVIVIHHNVKGANGKSTLFALIRRAFGDAFVKCASALLNPGPSSSPSGPNEELVSTKGKRVVLFSEPSSKLKLSASFIKELTGGDEQSTRANYGKKQTFVFTGMVHVLCNKIPELDEVDGGMRRRLRCIPYGSTFVDDVADADPARNVFVKQE